MERAMQLYRGMYSGHCFTTASVHIFFWKGHGRTGSLETKTFVDRAALLASSPNQVSCIMFSSSIYPFRKLPWKRFHISSFVAAKEWVLGFRVWAEAFTFYFSSVSWWLSEWEGPESRGWGSQKTVELVGIGRRHWEGGQRVISASCKQGCVSSCVKGHRTWALGWVGPGF